jgi:hypothetical protein
LARGGRLWGADAQSVSSLDPATAKVAQRISLVDSMDVMSLAVDGTILRVGIRHPGYVGAVQRIDLSGRVLVSFGMSAFRLRR